MEFFLTPPGFAWAKQNTVNVKGLMSGNHVYLARQLLPISTEHRKHLSKCGGWWNFNLFCNHSTIIHNIREASILQFVCAGDINVCTEFHGNPSQLLKHLDVQFASKQGHLIQIVPLLSPLISRHLSTAVISNNGRPASPSLEADEMMMYLFICHKQTSAAAS